MSINKEEKLIDQQTSEIKETTKQADTQSVDAWKAETEVNQSLSQVDQSVVLKKTKDEAHSLEQDSKWEFKNLSDPQEFQKAISILTVFYQEILKDT